MTIDELRRQLLGGDRTPCRTRPRCQHRFEGVTCGRPAELECDPSPDGHRPRYVCRQCLPYQACCIGPILRGDEYPAVRTNAEGAIVPARRGRR
jgi:hypothetical protein